MSNTLSDYNNAKLCLSPPQTLDCNITNSACGVEVIAIIVIILVKYWTHKIGRLPG